MVVGQPGIVDQWKIKEIEYKLHFCINFNYLLFDSSSLISRFSSQKSGQRLKESPKLSASISSFRTLFDISWLDPDEVFLSRISHPLPPSILMGIPLSARNFLTVATSNSLK